VWEGENVYLRRGVSLALGDAWRPAPLHDHDDLVTIETWQVSEEIGRRYARVSGDANPIHLHRWLARMFGFQSAIAHGMWIFARALAGLGGMPQHVYARAEFRAPVFLPAQVRFHGPPVSSDGCRAGAWTVQSLNGSQVHAVGIFKALGDA
jgi:acyl dehydratase